MCFSATASFTAGGTLLVIGAITARLARRRAEVPFALIPALFGVQQIIEGALWLTFPDKAPLLNTALTYFYSFFSHVFWPVYVPIAVLLLEPNVSRRRFIFIIALFSTAVGLYLLYYLVKLPIVAVVVGQHIRYESPHFYIITVMLLYVLGTCVSSMFSSHRWVNVFGVLALGSFIATYYFYTAWLISVWCFFAAVLSGIVMMYFIRLPANPAGDSPKIDLARVRLS